MNLKGRDMQGNGLEGYTEVTILGKIFFSTIIGVFASLTAYLNINAEALALYFTLLTVDLITGVMASFIVKEPMKLARFYAGIFSKFLMLIVPIVVAIIVKIQGDELLWFIKWTVVVLATSEGISIINNVLKSKKKKPLPQIDGVALVTDKLRVVLEALFNKSNGDMK